MSFNISRNELYEQWFESWKDKVTTRHAMQLLDDVGGTKEDLCITRWRVVMACFEAAQYKPELDPGKLYRDKISEAKRQIAQLARAARVLAQSAKNKHTGLMWATAWAEADSGVRLARIEPEGKMEVTEIAERYFKSLETALRGRLPELSGGPFFHRFTIGNLHFEQPISSGRPVTVATMLAFELAYHLRRHTVGHADHILQNGALMPNGGDPSFPVVAAFCNATLDTLLDYRQTGDNVRKLKNASLIRWPEHD
jgi:hypothetical protein